jgi:ketosteroid isomerase-like protein
MTADRLDRFARAWLRSDLEALRSYLTADALYSPLSGELVRGRDAVVRRFAEVLADDRGSVLRFEPSTVSGSFGVCRWRLAGRTSGGARFAIEGIDLYEFRGALIRVKDVYQKA